MKYLGTTLLVCPNDQGSNIHKVNNKGIKKCNLWSSD